MKEPSQFLMRNAKFTCSRLRRAWPRPWTRNVSVVSLPSRRRSTPSLATRTALDAHLAPAPVERLLIPRVDTAEEFPSLDLSCANEARAIEEPMASTAISVGRAVMQMHDYVYFHQFLHLLSLPLASPALPSAAPIRHSDRYRERLTERDLYETGSHLTPGPKVAADWAPFQANMGSARCPPNPPPLFGAARSTRC